MNPLKTIRRSSKMQRQALLWRGEGRPIVLVPTMGFLHKGHASLIELARKKAGDEGRVIVSLFVNPIQFSPNEDFAQYPRDEHNDLALCKKLHVDAVFIPSISEIYPSSRLPFSTYVSEDCLSQSMEGRARPAHFRGVVTIVAILFHIAQPSHSVFGEKDFQQAIIIKKMVGDLRFPLKIIIGKTIREADGLAMSSRNAYLTNEQRAHASILYRCIQIARKEIRAAHPILASALKQRIAHMISETPGAEWDYIEFFNPLSLKAVSQVRPKDRLALAVSFGKTRLIDNGRL